MTIKRKPAHLGLCLISLAIASCFAAGAALANPTGPTVVNGTAAVVQNANLLQITNSPNAIINWQRFSIGAGEITRFIQQSQASAVLNRVIGAGGAIDPSVLLGALQSNGRVFLINPSGILFGAGAQVDVAGLVATSLNLSNADFLANRLKFTEMPGAGSIVNQGTINTAAGGNVYLVGPAITNSGIITSPKGEVVLAAGNSVELVDPGTPNLRVEIIAPDNQATNLGQIVVDSGRVGIYAGLINHSGTIRADSVETTADGRIVLTATKSVMLEAGSVTSASGAKAGEIRVTASEMVQIAGRLDASAPNGGDGGFIETSAAKVKIEEGAIITTAAAQGATGTWLIDPTDYTIASSGGDITGSQLSTNLGSTSVTIVSSGGATAGSGDVNVNDAVSWSANTLTLTAARDVNINAVMTASGTSALALNPATGNGADSAVAGGTVKAGFNTDGSFKGRVDFGARSGTGLLTINGNSYTVINSLGAEGSGTGTDLQGMQGNLGSFYALGSDIDASATSGWNSLAGFAPVGTSFGSAFAGKFDGLGHTITGLTINRPSEDNVGLFGYVGWPSAAEIRNVGLVNVNVLGGGTSAFSQKAAGGLVGLLGAVTTSTVTNSYSTGSVSGVDYVGGLVGRNNAGAITGSYSTAGVTGSGSYIGGLVGFNPGSISNSYSTGNVSGVYIVGGLAGENDGTLSNVYSTGNVNASLNNSVNSVGGLVGSNWGTITNSYNTGAVSAGVAVTKIGGLVGENPVGFGTITNSYWDTNTSGRLNCTGSGSSAGCTGLTTGSMKTQANFSGWDFTNTWRIDEGVSYPTLRVFWAPPPPPPPSTDNTWLGLLDSYWTTVGNWSLGHVPTATEAVIIPDVAGTAFVEMAGGPFTVKNITSAELFKLTGTGTSFTLTDDGRFNAGLNLGAGTSLTSLGTLSLSSYTLGAGAKINLTQSGAGILAIGGLPYIVINSLGVAGSTTGIDLQGMGGNLSGRYAMGSDIDASATASWNSGKGFAPVGDAFGSYTGVFDGLGHTITSISINDPNNILMGLFGISNGATFRNLGLIGGSVRGYTQVGSLVGNSNLSTIANVYNTGSVAGVYGVGGLVGYLNGGAGITDSYNTGAVSGTSQVGGIVGIAYSGGIINSFNTGSVTASGDYAGGLVGKWDSFATIRNSHNTGAVNGARHVGGLAGFFDGGISDSYNSGPVGSANGVQYIGGLAGDSFNGNISNSYNTGSVTGSDSLVGGLVGDYQSDNLIYVGNMVNSHNTGSVSGTSMVGGLAGRTVYTQISSSYGTGIVTGVDTVGGLVGWSTLGIVDNSVFAGSVNGGNSTGGLVGVGNGFITYSYATGSVTGTIEVGGLAGHSFGVIENSYSMADVTGVSAVGGLVGRASGSTIRNSYSAGRVTGSGQAGGLIGQNDASTITQSYWNTEISGKSNCIGTGSATGCTGLTTVKMKQQANYVGWDFSTVWGIDENASFPYLRTNEQNPHPSAPIFATTNSAAAAGIDVTNQVVASLSTLGQLFTQFPATTNEGTSDQNETSLGSNLTLICNK